MVSFFLSQQRHHADTDDASSLAGRWNVNALPWRNSLVTAIEPPCNSTSCRTRGQIGRMRNYCTTISIAARTLASVITGQPNGPRMLRMRLQFSNESPVTSPAPTA